MACGARWVCGGGDSPHVAGCTLCVGCTKLSRSIVNSIEAATGPVAIGGVREDGAVGVFFRYEAGRLFRESVNGSSRWEGEAMV